MYRFIQKAGFSLLILLILSCSSYQITNISILVPGEVEFPNDAHRISLLLLKNEHNMPAGRLDSIDNMMLDTSFNYYQYAWEYLYGLQDGLIESPRFERIKISRLNAIDSIGNKQEYDWREIIRICKADTTDALILVDNFCLDDSLKVLYWIEGYRVEYELKNKMSYDVLNPKMQQITGHYSLTNNNTWSGFDLSFEGAVDQLPAGEDMILHSCYATGLKAGLTMAPSWYDNIRRIYYTRGNKLIARGADYAKQDMWREAANYWRMAADSKKAKNSAKAAFNMALACEIEDKLELAHEWISFSDSIKSNRFTIFYQQIITNRLDYETILNKQLGFEE